MIKDTHLDIPAAWELRAAAGYEQLGWVDAKPLRDKIISLAALHGSETVVDAGTGTGTVLDALAPQVTTGKLIGFDISQQMMDRRTKLLPPRAELRVANIYDTGLETNSADVITARQVFHNLRDIPGAVSELGRVLKPQGRLIVCEYVPVTPAVQEFERPIFELKEAGRHLFTGEELAETIAATFLAEYPGGEIRLDYAVLPQYSVKDWMENSGLPSETQIEIVRRYQEAPSGIQEMMRATHMPDGDMLIDRPAAFVVAQKPPILSV